MILIMALKFINALMPVYCIENKITFTRSRAYKKRDSYYVEKKNYSVIRRAVGYYRYDSVEELEILNELYLHLGCYINFFSRLQNLYQRQELEAKLLKNTTRQKPQHRRVLDCSDINDKIKAWLRRQYDSLNPAELKRKIKIAE